MDFAQSMQKALSYIEENLDGSIDYAAMAKMACCSEYNFLRVFSVLSGMAMAEYIRSRRLTLAGQRLLASDAKVVDLALQCGYDSPESFSRAFAKFHGVSPAKARQSGRLRSVSPLKLKFSLEGGQNMQYRVEQAKERHFIGYTRRFTGAPAERKEQEHDFFVSTRFLQYALQGMVKDTDNLYTLVENADGEGYDFTIAVEYNTEGTWLNDEFYDCLLKQNSELGERFRKIAVPGGAYAVFETARERKPVAAQFALLQQVFSEWLPGSGFQLAARPEVTRIYWPGDPNRDQRFITLFLPVEEA